jgi:hypothetical protein
MLTPSLVIQQMKAFNEDIIPPRWQTTWQAMIKDSDHEDDPYTLQEWLEEVYFRSDKVPEFTAGDVAQVGELISRMLKFEPSRRATANDILTSAWFG